MSAGYSKTPLLRKLGIKPGFSMLIINEPENYRSLLGELPEDTIFTEKEEKGYEKLL